MRKKQQQGDLNFFVVGKVPDNMKPIDNKGVIAIGEVSGHKHRFEHPERVRLYAIDGGKEKLTAADVGVRFIEVLEPVALLHEEHNAQMFAPGLYQLGFVHEYDYEKEETRFVAD